MLVQTPSKKKKKNVSSKSNIYKGNIIWIIPCHVYNLLKKIV